MLVERESLLCGSCENDYPEGDYVWECMYCTADFHGDEYDHICYKCAQEEDAENKTSRDLFAASMGLFVLVIVVGLLCL